MNGGERGRGPGQAGARGRSGELSGPGDRGPERSARPEGWAGLDGGAERDGGPERDGGAERDGGLERDGRPEQDGGADEHLPLLPGFREMALRRMAAERRRLVTDLAVQRQAAGLSQTEVAARMGTSQSAVARLESGGADARASTLERYAAAIGCQITWRLQSSIPGGRPPRVSTGRQAGERMH